MRSPFAYTPFGGAGGLPGAGGADGITRSRSYTPGTDAPLVRRCRASSASVARPRADQAGDGAHDRRVLGLTDRGDGGLALEPLRDLHQAARRDRAAEP